MADIQMSGIATGIDTSTIVQQLITVEGRKKANLQVQKMAFETQQTALSGVETTLGSLVSSAGALSNADTLVAFSVNSSDTDKVTLTAAEDANPGSHSIEVDQLATGETWIQDVSTFDHKTDYVGEGSFIYSYNNQEVTITTAANETTLQDFVNLINNGQSNPGVTASLLNQGGKYHLMLSGQETGEDYRISVNSTSTEVWTADAAWTLASNGTSNALTSTKLIELSQFGAASLSGSEVIEITGTDRYGHAITQVDLDLTSYTTVDHLLQEIEDSFGGNVKARLDSGKIVVTDTAPGASSLSVALAFNAHGSLATLTVPTMAVSKEGGATSANLTSLESSSFIRTQNAQNSRIKVDGYPTGAAVSEEQTVIVTTGSVTGGTYNLTYKGRTTANIAWNADAAAIQAALEALDSVAAGDITVTGATDITGGDLLFTFDDTLGDVPLVTIDDSALTGTGSPGVTISQSVQGVNPWITRNSNIISDAISGVTLTIYEETDENTPVSVSLSRNTSAVSSKVEALVGSYNKLLADLKSKTEYDTATKKMGSLSNDLAVSFVKTQMRDAFSGIIEGFVDTEDNYVQASDIGISFDGEGMMKFDKSIFSDAIKEDYKGVLELLGATKSGNSESDTVSFYDSSDKYTSAGVFHVKVKVQDLGLGNVITEAYIKGESDTTWRAATWSGSLITGASEFDENGNPEWPENGLQLSVDLSLAGEFGYVTPVEVRVKQGMTGILEDLLKNATSVGGRFDISKESLEAKMTRMDERITDEESRLERLQTRLTQKYSRLEATIARLQQQLSVVNAYF
ncbi:MAG: flagellar filament capping protein FliD [Phycisphaerae bacterium]|nr:flagellar filament capping protein FliD [Phycisphaerae bacterium]